MTVTRKIVSQVLAGPRMLGSGRFEVHEHDGAGLVRWQADGAPAWTEQEIPAPVWAVLKALADGQQPSRGTVMRALGGLRG